MCDNYPLLTFSVLEFEFRFFFFESTWIQFGDIVNKGIYKMSLTCLNNAKCFPVPSCGNLSELIGHSKSGKLTVGHLTCLRGCRRILQPCPSVSHSFHVLNLVIIRYTSISFNTFQRMFLYNITSRGISLFSFLEGKYWCSKKLTNLDSDQLIESLSLEVKPHILDTNCRGSLI